MELSRFGAAVLSSTLHVAKEDPIALYIAIVNQSDSELEVRFPTAKQFDFALLDMDGNEYWRWSTGKAFEGDETIVRVRAGGFHVDGDEIAVVPLPADVAGYVTLIGELPSSNLPFTGQLRINIVIGRNAEGGPDEAGKRPDGACFGGAEPAGS